jgi:hypothetical protein
VLHDLFNPVNDRSKSGEFLKPGGYKALKLALENVKKAFEETPEELGSKAAQIWKQFQDEKVDKNADQDG